MLGSTLLVAACGGSNGAVHTPAIPAAQPVPTAQLLLTFDGIVAEFGAMVARVDNAGSAAVRTEVATGSGGRIRLVPSGDGAGGRFPAHVDDAEAPLAAILVWSDDEALSPGLARFTFGASFRLDAISEGDRDNGDNLVQRGLFVDPAQFKLQIDHGVPSCRIAGTEGEVVVKLAEPVETESWYSVRCTRSRKKVKLEVREVGGSAAPMRAVRRGRTGEVSFGPDTPMSVGAKVGADGAIPISAPDQFNGAVDDIFVEIAD